jgi:uncharacterized RDD family membrane protein YckC
MKCPRCNYVSFDSMPRCKKCGFQFKPSALRQEPLDIASIIPEKPVKDGNAGANHADAALSRTVSSIRDSLAEIDGTSSAEGTGLPPEKPFEVDAEDLKFQVDRSYMDTSLQFSDTSEINWEESVPLGDDNVNIPFPEDDSGSTGPDRAGWSAELPITAGDQFQAALRQVGEELKEIEDAPPVTADAPPLIEREPVLFDLPAGSSMPAVDTSAAPVSKGGFWIRTMAYLIDTVILEFLSLILMLVGMLAMAVSGSGLPAMDEDRMLGWLVPYYLFSSVVTIVYFTYFHGSVGQTPGKMLCGLKVVRTDGESLGYGRAFLRWTGYLLSSLMFGLGFLWIAWDRNKQAWHDKLAGTHVIRL